MTVGLVIFKGPSDGNLASLVVKGCTSANAHTAARGHASRIANGIAEVSKYKIGGDVFIARQKLKGTLLMTLALLFIAHPGVDLTIRIDD